MPPLPPAEAIPGMTPFMPPPPIAADSSAAAVQPLPAKVAPVSAGAAADHPAGTDIPPTEDAEPIPANVAPPMKCANSGAVARPMNKHQDPVTLTVLIVSCTAPTPKKPWTAL